MKLIIYIGIYFLSFFSFSQNWRDSLLAGKQLYTQKKFEQAYDKFISAQQYAPEQLEFNNEIGNSAYKKGDFETAENVFQRAFERAKNKEEKAAHAHNLGNAQFKQKKYSDAIESYKTALRNDPDNEAARYNLAEAKRNLKEQKKKQQNEAQNNQQKPADNNADNNQNKDEKDDRAPEQNQNQQNQPNSTKENEDDNKNEADKLSSKKTERMLDELMKKEMKTKRKVQGSLGGGKNEQVKSGKRW